MSEWTDGYRAALADIGRMIYSRGGIVTTGGQRGRRADNFDRLLSDLEGDALVIEREQDNRIRRRRLRAAREALPLFDEVPP